MVGSKWHESPYLVYAPNMSFPDRQKCERSTWLVRNGRTHKSIFFKTPEEAEAWLIPKIILFKMTGDPLSLGD